MTKPWVISAWIRTVIGVPVVILGLVGNTLTLVVLFPQRRSPSTFLLMALAVADNFYLIAYIPQIIQSIMYLPGDGYLYSYYLSTYLKIIIHMLPELFTRALSMWFTVIIATTRYIAVALPFHARRYITIKKIMITIVTITMLSMMLYMPAMAYTSYVWCTIHPSCNYNATLWGQARRKVKDLALIYTIVIEVVVVVIPLILLIIFGSMLIRAYITSQQAVMNSSTARDQDGHQVTLMTIVVIVVLIVCQMPYLIFIIDLWTSRGMLRSMLESYASIWSGVASVLKPVNSAVNFLIYSLCRKTFRDQVRALCCCKTRNTDNTAQPMQEIS